ncbi:MAG TPA: hypothetical protein VFW53_10920 [Gallionella sp.]|nr:hypothetical protein [Gallionella sp.]
MKELLDWTEKAALENLKFHLQNADNLAKEANTTLTVLLAALGAALAYTLKASDSGIVTTATIGVAVLTLYLTSLCGLLVFKCMKIAPIPAPANEPRNLYQKDFEFDALREVELSNMQERIDQAVARNDGTTAWLNRVRIGAVLSPFIFLGVSLCVALMGLGRVGLAVAGG